MTRFVLSSFLLTAATFAQASKLPNLDAYRAVGFANNAPTMALLSTTSLEAWNWKTQQTLSTQSIDTNDFFGKTLNQVEVDPTGSYAVLRCDYGCGTYVVYDLKNSKKVFRASGGGDGFTANSTSRPIFSADGTLVTLSMGLEGIVVRSTKDGEIKYKFQDADDTNKWFIDAAFSKDNSRIYTLDRHCRLKERLLKDGTLLHQATMDTCARIALSKDETVFSITKHAALEIDFNRKAIVRDAKLNGTTQIFTYSEAQNRLFTYTKVVNGSDETAEVHALNPADRASTLVRDLTGKGSFAGFTSSDGKTYAVTVNEGFIFTQL